MIGVDPGPANLASTALCHGPRHDSIVGFLGKNGGYHCGRIEIVISVRSNQPSGFFLCRVDELTVAVNCCPQLVNYWLGVLFSAQKEKSSLKKQPCGR